jgi:hypothetical protein
MSFLTNKLHQKATWWALIGGDGFGGDRFASPILVDCRWEDRSEVFRGQIDRREMVSNAVIYLDIDVAAGDYLCQGDQTGQANPTTVTGAFKIQLYQKKPDLRSLDYLRRAVL